MKSIRSWLTATLLAAGAAAAAAGGVSGASAADDAAGAPTPGFSGMHHHGGEWRLLRQLGLSDAQKAQIKTIVTSARPQMQSLHEQMRANALKLKQTQPSDPNYAGIAAQASQTHGSLSAEMMNQRAAMRAQVFKVLTPEQQTQLAALEDSQADRQGRKPQQ